MKIQLSRLRELIIEILESEEVEAELQDEAKKNTLWGNIHARRKAGKRRLKPGDKNYPKTLDI